MEATERKLALEHLNASRERLLATVRGLSAEQRMFQAAERRWSVADCLEHLIIVENFVWKTMQNVLQTPPQPEKQAEVRPRDQIVLEMVPARTRRVAGPPGVHPTRSWRDFGELVQQFEIARARTLQFAAYSDADLRCHFFPHPIIGDLDCYQWLLFLGTHCERHVRQMEEVMADPGFPARHSASSGQQSAAGQL